MGAVSRRRNARSVGDNADDLPLPSELIRHAPAETNDQVRAHHKARPEVVVTRPSSTQFWPENADKHQDLSPKDPIPSAKTVKLAKQLASWTGADDNPLEDDPQQIEQVITALPVAQQKPARTRARKSRPLSRLRGSSDVHRLKSAAVRALLHSAESPAEVVFLTLCYLGRQPKEVEKLTVVETINNPDAVKTLIYERANNWLWMPIQGGPTSHCRLFVSERLKQALEQLPQRELPLKGLTKKIDRRGRSAEFRRLSGLTITAERLRAAGWPAVRPIAGNDMVTEVLSGQLRVATATDLAYRKLSNQSLQETFDGFLQQLNLAPRAEPELFELYREGAADHIGSESTFDIDDALELMDALTLSADSLKRLSRTLPVREYNQGIVDCINRITATLYLLLSLCTASRPWGAQTCNSQHATRQGDFILHSEKASKRLIERRWLPLPSWLAQRIEQWRDWVERWSQNQQRIGWQVDDQSQIETVLPGCVRLKPTSATIRIASFTHQAFKSQLSGLVPESSAWKAYQLNSRGNALRHLVATRAQRELGATAQHWLLGHIRETDANLHWSSSRSIVNDERDIRRFQKALLADICPQGLSLPSVEALMLREVSGG